MTTTRKYFIYDCNMNIFGKVEGYNTFNMALKIADKNKEELKKIKEKSSSESRYLYSVI